MSQLYGHYLTTNTTKGLLGHLSIEGRLFMD